MIGPVAERQGLPNLPYPSLGLSSDLSTGREYPRLEVSIT